MSRLLPRAGKDGNVRALTRGLSILGFVNANGAVRAGEIAAALSLPRPTVYRLLATLEEEGYVAHSPTDSRVQITRLAAGLGDGYEATSRICQAVGPVFARHAGEIVWPLSLSVYENAAMVIQETTHDRSPLSIDRGMTGYRLPMLRTSAGRAYLSACGSRERALILDHISRLDDPADRPFLAPDALDAMDEETSRLGAAVRVAGGFRPKTASIAMPVTAGKSVLGCVSIIWIRSAMTLDEALARYTAPLRAITGRLAKDLGAETEPCARDKLPGDRPPSGPGADSR